MMIDKVIEPGTLRAEANGAVVKLRLPWYRTLPLSNVQVDEVKIDGEVVGGDRLTFELEGGTWPVSEMRGLTTRSWFVTDSADLHLAGVKLEPGSEHEVEVTVSLYPPYIKGLRRAVRWSQSMGVK